MSDERRPNGRRQREAHPGRAGKPTGPRRGPGPSLTRQAAALASASLATQASALLLLMATRAAESGCGPCSRTSWVCASAAASEFRLPVHRLTVPAGSPWRSRGATSTNSWCQSSNMSSVQMPWEWSCEPATCRSTRLRT